MAATSAESARPSAGAVRLADGAVLLATALWSLNIIVVKLGLQSAGPLTYSAGRFAVGGLVLLVLAHRLEGPLTLPRGRALGRVALVALLGVALNQAAFTYGLALTSADNVAMITAVTPLVVAAVVVWRHGLRLPLRVWVALGTGLVGVGLVVGAGGLSRGTLVGDLVSAGMPLSFAAYLLLLPPLLRRYRPLTLSAMVTVLGAVMLLPIGAVEAAATPVHWSWGFVGLWVFSALGAVAVTNFLFYAGLAVLGPARAAAYNYAMPFLGVLFAAVLIAEPIRPLQLLGGLLILGGVAFGRPPHTGVAPVPLAHPRPLRLPAGEVAADRLAG